MAEVVMDPRGKRQDRWLPREKFFTKARVITGLHFLGQMLPGYLLTFANVLEIPSGLMIALGSALAALGKPILPTVLGMSLAAAVSAFSGLAPRWELLMSAVMLLAAPRVLDGAKNGLLMAFTAALCVPTVAVSTLESHVVQVILALGGGIIAALSAPVFARALRVLFGGKPVACLEERLALAYLAAFFVCGGGRLMLLGVNLGVLCAAAVTLAMAFFLGSGAAAIAGMVGGLALALMGLPMMLSIALAMGGFLAGVVHAAEKRPWTCAAFAVGAFLPLLLSGSTGVGMGAGTLAGALGLLLLPDAASARLETVFALLRGAPSAPGDAYAASVLRAWERTIAAMAQTVPSPCDGVEVHDAAWWESRLCEGCPERESCGCLTTPAAVASTEGVWKSRTAPEQVWTGALDALATIGCERLPYLKESLNALRWEDAEQRRALRQAEAQREMLVTHLSAMSGAARRFAQLSGGGTWWEDAADRKIRRALEENAAPATLRWVRRIRGHVRAAFDLERSADARRQAENLCLYLAPAVDAPLTVQDIREERLILMERPRFTPWVDVAMASVWLHPEDGEGPCGDYAWSGSLEDGSFLVTLADGMGHGPQAERIARQAVTLLRLCLDAGYTREQALTAVNGMLLLGGVEERFATADVLLLDLWTGRASLDKFGSAPTWLHTEEGLSRLTGDALPLGILEGCDSDAHGIQLHPGDTLILLTDGVEEAFLTGKALEKALLQAMESEHPADTLLQAAADADEGLRRDDQSAVFLRILED